MSISYRQKRVLCLITALIMLLSGMCLESIRADSFLGYRNNDLNPVYTNAHYNISGDNDICTNEMIALKPQSSAVYRIRRSPQKRILRNIAIVFVIVMSMCNILHMSQSIARHRNIRIIIEKFIIKYIHHQDGAKG